MRRLADADRIRAFMDAVGRAAKTEIRLYFTGGATAVLSGWRSSTIDVGILMIPEDDHCQPGTAGIRVFRSPSASSGVAVHLARSASSQHAQAAM